MLLALACRVLVRAVARKRAAEADEKLRAAVRRVSQEMVVQPISAELAAYGDLRERLAPLLAR